MAPPTKPVPPTTRICMPLSQDPAGPGTSSGARRGTTHHSYCALICTFALGATLQREFAGLTLDRFGNVWSTTQESIGCPDALTTVQPNPERTPWLVPALTVSRHGLRPISTTSAAMKFEGWKMVEMAYFA